MKNRIVILVCTTLVCAAISQCARAAEIHLRVAGKCEGALVCLGDVAEIFSDNADQTRMLTATELFPAPAAGNKRYAKAREIQDLLASRGVNLLEHRLTGASQVEISGPASAAKTESAPTSTMERQAADAVRQAALEYLQEQSPTKEARTIDFTLSPEQVRTIAAASYAVAVDGGQSPWTGSQTFAVTIRTTKQLKTFPLETYVSLPPLVVVAVRSLGRGDMVQAGDVALQRSKPGQSIDSAFTRVEDVLGSEATRLIGPGQIIDRDSMRQPLLVRKGDAVTVYSRSAGLQVRTTARARDDGSLGDLISVESLLNRQAFFARVSGIQEVEIYARAADTSAAQNQANYSLGGSQQGGQR
jgi:flagella basal body P-ring formation protein FlgA